MSINTKQLNELQKFVIGSFALWDNKGLCSKNFFETRISELKNNIILLGLNRSGKEPNKQIYPDNYKMYEFRNFHSENHQGDKYLQKIIQLNKLEKISGSYMTDFYYDIESSSVNIKKDISNIIESTKCLIEQINILKSDTLTVICFGPKVFSHLLIGFDIKDKIIEGVLNIKQVKVLYKEKYNIDIYGVWHYTNRGYNIKNVKELKQQLIHINKLLD